MSDDNDMEALLGFYAVGVPIYSEVADADVIKTVDEQYPQVREFLDKLNHALYLVLYAAALGFFESQTAQPLPGEYAPVSPAQVIDRGRILWERAYYDAWVEAHSSGAYDDLAGLTPPENWPVTEGGNK